MNSKGDKYESEAANFLSKKGYKLLKRNYSIRRGEIDLVMLAPECNTIVFVEVRYRKNNQYGGAEQSITRSKQTKIITAAKHYLNHFNLWENPTRFDVIAISSSKSSTLQFNWITNAFTA